LYMHVKKSKRNYGYLLELFFEKQAQNTDVQYAQPHALA
jgi:hypothetical protein